MLIRFLVAFLLLFFISSEMSAAATQSWDDWRTYENDYFRVHSNAKQKKVQELLEELESFRLVVGEAIKVKIPADAKKTDVLLFKNKRGFRKVAWHRNLAGYVTSIDGSPLIVMPASNWRMSSETTIKHEYVHIAQAYDKKRYPRWWIEGLAEILSTVEYHGDLALVGKPNLARWKYLSRELNYDKLVDENYDGLKRSLGADAYAQYWLLAIYSLVHSDGMYRDELGEHILGFRKTADALKSFTAAYGRTPQDFAKEAMRNFGKRSYSYKPLFYRIDLSERDTNPIISAVDSAFLEHLFDVLVRRKKAAK